MAKKSSQAQALMATSRGVTAQPPIRQGYSPLFDQYNRWSTIYGTSLPRTFDTFRSGDFSPFEPILPNPIDMPEPSGRPRPRRFQFPVGWNLPVGQPGTEGLKLANFQVLRDMAEVGSIPRRAIEIVKSDLLNLDWDIIATPQAEKAMQGNPSARKDFEERRAEAKAFFDNPDPNNYYDFWEWLAAFAEDLLVLDAVAIHIQPARGGKKAGPFGSNVGALELLDATSVRPLLDTLGARPQAPQPAYQQLIWGVPRVDLMDIINLGPDATIEDLKELDPLLQELMQPIDEWSGDQLLYLRQTTRTWTPYGFGPLEQCLLPASIMMARQTWQWEFYRSGSLPAIFLDPGEMVVTADEARDLQEAINMTGGDLASRHQVIVLPPGAKVMPQKDTDLADTFDELMIAEIAMAFGLSITDFGMTPKTAQLTSPAAGKENATASTDKTVRRSTLPRANKIQRLLTKMLQVQLGQKDMMWTTGITEQGETQNDLENRWISRVKASISAIDEARIALGEDPYGEPWSSVPLAFTAEGVSPLPTSVESAEVSLQNAKNPPAAPPGQPTAKPSDLEKQPEEAAPATAAHAAARAVQRENPSAKSFEAELQILERYLKRGRPIKEFVPKALSRSELSAATQAKNPKEAVALIRNTHHRAVRRDTALDPERNGIADELGKLVNRVSQHVLQSNEFTPKALEVMQSAIVRAMNMGASHAGEDFGMKVPDLIATMALQRASSQLPYLTTLVMSVLGGISSARLNQRVGMYGEVLTGAYENGYGLVATQAINGVPANEGPGRHRAVITWISEDDDSTCELCEGRNGEMFTTDTLPGWPGDGSFGGPICEGGPLCRCTLSYSDGESTLEGQNTLRPHALAGDLPDELTGQRHAEQWARDRERFTSQLPAAIRPGEVSSARSRAIMRDQIRQQIAHELAVHPADVSAHQVAERVPAAMKRMSGLVGEVHRMLKKHYPKDSIEWVLGMNWTRASVALSEISVTGPSSNKDAKTIQRMADDMKDGEPIKPVILVKPEDGLMQVADGHHRVTAALMAKRRVIPAYVGRPRVENDWRKQVMDMQLVRATKMHDPDGMGGTPDFEESGTGNLSESYMPGGLVLEEGQDNATRNETMVGKIVEDPSDDPVRHEFGNAAQYNKSADPVAAGVALVAKDTGRVLMLQRALDDSSNGGKWEFPGGKLEEGEESLDAAVREWQEEVGLELPGECVDIWSNGIYDGYVFEMEHEADLPINPDSREVLNPDDPDQDHIETVAWWAVDDIKDNPAVRKEVLKNTDWSCFGG